jgi:hypothetical protein
MNLSVLLMEILDRFPRSARTAFRSENISDLELILKGPLLSTLFELEELRENPETGVTPSDPESLHEHWRVLDRDFSKEELRKLEAVTRIGFGLENLYSSSWLHKPEDRPAGRASTRAYSQS